MVIVQKCGSFEKAVRKFIKESAEIVKEVRERRGFVKPSQIKRKKERQGKFRTLLRERRER